MRLAHPAGLAVAALAVVVVAVHLYRRSAGRRPVSTVRWWADTTSSAPSQWGGQLRWSRLLVVQLLAVGIAALAVARPEQARSTTNVEHLVVVVDVSGSMQATDGIRTRMAEAVERAGDELAALAGSARATVVELSSTPRVVADRVSSASAVSALDRLVPSLAPPDVVATAGLVAGLLGDGGQAVLFSDGTLDPATDAWWPPGTRHEEVGGGDLNWSVGLVVDGRADAPVALVSVINHGSQGGSQEVWLEVEGDVVARREVRLGASEHDVVAVEFSGGPRVSARLTAADQFDGDDVAHALVGSTRPIAVTVVGRPDRFVMAALAAMESVTVRAVTEPNPADPGDVTVFVDSPVPDDWSTPFVGFGVPESVPGIKVDGTLTSAVPVLVDSGDQWLTGLDLSGLSVTLTQQLTVAGDQVLVGSASSPLIVKGSRGGQRFALFGFAPERSTMGGLAAFPVLLERMLTDLADAAGGGMALGSPIAADGDVLATAPSGRTVEARAEDDRPTFDERGFWEVTSGPQRRTVAVNVASSESILAPRAVALFDVGQDASAAPESPQRPWWTWVVLVLSAVLVAEFGLARPWRSRGWARVGFGRLGVIGAVLAAAVWPPDELDHHRLQVVVLVDQSPSMTAEGAARAAAVAASISTNAPGAVVYRAQFGGYSPSGDPSAMTATLADGLRFARGTLVGSGDRRVVVISDGRLRTDRVADELEQLVGEAVVVEVVPVSPPPRPDVAVLAVDVPAPVRAAMTVPVAAHLRSVGDQQIRLQTALDGEVVDARVVELADGDSVIEVPITAPTTGTHRIEVTATATTDRERGNDVGHAVLRVVTTASVLVVEGAPDAGRWVAEALESPALGVQRIEPGALGGVDEVLGFDAVVLVDVAASQLSDVQQTALASAVRDGGRGLVVVGGTRSRALSDFSTSKLDGLLPVTSGLEEEVGARDVAQVLAIDSSASMGACHCDELVFDEQGSLMSSDEESGLDKTDLSRAAVAAAVAALGDNDEVGVMAFDTTTRWLVPLQLDPDEDLVSRELAGLSAQGETDLLVPLVAAADALRSSQRQLRHVVLLTDGFTYVEAFETLVEQARKLADEGITVSVIATGEVYSTQLEPVAVAGRGRFYSGIDLLEIPELMRTEALLASREADRVTRATVDVGVGAPSVTGLATAPPLDGYVALAARDAATVSMRIEGSPLLTSWRVGLGTVTVWSSDGGDQWARSWRAWEGFAPFWQAVVQGTFPLRGVDEAVLVGTATPAGIELRAERPGGWPAGHSMLATVTSPQGQAVEVTMNSDGAGRLTALASVTGTGVFVVSAQNSSGEAVTGAAVVPYDPDLVPRDADTATMEAWSAVTGGRGLIDAAQAVEPTGVTRSASSPAVPGWWLPAAIAAWVGILIGERVVRRG